MKIQCPKCKQVVPPDQVNMAADLAFCPLCNEGFKISESLDQDVINADVLRNPPKGAWIRKDIDHIVVGGTTRSPIAFFLVPFMCIWSGGSLGGIYGSQILKGKFDLTASLFGIPFILGSLFFWTIALMAVCGKVEVTIGQNSSVFIGVGRLGWRRRFDWFDVTAIHEDRIQMRSAGSSPYAIILEGKQRLKITGLNEQRRYFVLNALKYLRAETPSRSVASIRI